MITISSRDSWRRQSGAASVAIAVLLLLILLAAVLSVSNMSGSSVIDAARQEEQTAALFLAESGVQRAQATINAAAKSGTYTDTTCTNLNTVTGALGRGSFSYTASSDPALCGGTNPACTSCTINTTGAIGASTRRTIRTVIKSTFTDGIGGCGDNFSLVLPIPSTLEATAAAFTHIAWRARPISGVCEGGNNNNATVASCTITGGGVPPPSCDFTKGWKVERVGTNNSSSVGVFGTPPSTAGNYTINFALEGANNSATRSFAATGVVLFPLLDTTPVNYVGSYGLDNKTADTSDLDGFVPPDWTCGAANGTPNDMSKAAGADTLFYGLSALGQTAGNEAASLVFGIQPMWRVSSLVGGNGDYLYSQSWISYNPAYWPVVTGATNGADFTGATGAKVQGTITLATLNVTANIGNCPNASNQCFGELRANDSIAGAAPGTVITAAGCTGTVPPYTCTVSPSQTVATTTTFTASSNILRVTAVASGVLTAGDTISSSGIAGTPTIQPFSTSGTTGTGGIGEYVLSAQVTPVRPSTPAASMQSAGTTITLPAGGTAIPSEGTALGVPSGTGAFASVSLIDTSHIDGTTLTVPSGTQPVVGDALYGRYVQPGTRITEVLTATTYKVTPSQTASAGTILARAAVRGADSIPPSPAPLATSFVVSRAPTTRLSGNAQLCGGICPFLFPFTGSGGNSGTHFTISGLTSGRDWSSGFACLNNVNPSNIQHLSRVIASQSSWSEPVR